MTAKRRCGAAVAWFQGTVERMARSGVLDRDRLEEAANAYFAQLVREVDQPRDFPAEDYDYALAFQIEQAENEIERQDDHLTAHNYTDGDRNAARAMLKPMGVDFEDLGPDGQLAALNHVLRAKRQQMRYLLHSLQTPASRFAPDDELFRQLPATPQVLPQKTASDALPRLLRPEVTLGSSIDKFMAYQTKKGWKGSIGSVACGRTQISRLAVDCR